MAITIIMMALMRKQEAIIISISSAAEAFFRRAQVEK